jgi:2-keto-3-deoxy-L-rhamnonate aldolase RhmA
VVAQPRLPAEELVHATAGWLETAHGCDASVMLVPQTLARAQGAIAVVVCAETDPALTIAARIAVAAGESLLLLVSGPPDLAAQAAARARAAHVPASRIAVRSIAGTEPEDVVRGLGAGTERLVVLTRGACGMNDAAVSSHIATSRSVPVLVVCH